MKRDQRESSSVLPATPVQAVLLSIVVSLTLTSVAGAQGIDRVQRRNGIDSGKIAEVSPLGVTISKGGVDKKIPAEEIRNVTYAGEPDGLNAVRKAFRAGRYQEVSSDLSEIETEDIDRKEILQDIAYLKSASQVYLALSGRGDVQKATSAIRKFLAEHRRSYHVPAAIELYGDLLRSSGNFTEALSQYGKLSKAPSDYFKARAALLKGRTYQEDNKHDQAIAQFEGALKAAGSGENTESIRTEATLHRAVSQSATGGGQESAEAIQELIARAQPEDTTYLARAYNALGDSYLLSGNQKAARDAFLHVDILFSNASTEHAKALYELAGIWKVLGQQSRSREAMERLQSEYPGSRWATK